MKVKGRISFVDCAPYLFYSYSSPLNQPPPVESTPQSYLKKTQRVSSTYKPLHKLAWAVTDLNQRRFTNQKTLGLFLYETRHCPLRLPPEQKTSDLLFLFSSPPHKRINIFKGCSKNSTGAVLLVCLGFRTKMVDRLIDWS